MGAPVVAVEVAGAAKAYAEARAEHGGSELLDEIAAAKPEMNHTRFHSPEELRERLTRLREAVALAEDKATGQELGDYRRFVVSLANKVAAAHREHGQRVSPTEATAIQDIIAALGATST